MASASNMCSRRPVSEFQEIAAPQRQGTMVRACPIKVTPASRYRGRDWLGSASPETKESDSASRRTPNRIWFRGWSSQHFGDRTEHQKKIKQPVQSAFRPIGVPYGRLQPSNIASTPEVWEIDTLSMAGTNGRLTRQRRQQQDIRQGWTTTIARSTFWVRKQAQKADAGQIKQHQIGTAFGHRASSSCNSGRGWFGRCKYTLCRRFCHLASLAQSNSSSTRGHTC